MAMQKEDSAGEILADDGVIALPFTIDGSHDEIPACQSCRKKKSKCSRTQPCAQCVKSAINCVYEDTRPRGGIRAGAIERLNQRMDTIENMFLGQGVLFHQVMKAHLPTAARVQCTNSGVTELLSSYTNNLKRTYVEAAASLGDAAGQEDSGNTGPSESSSSAPKRRQLDDAFMGGKESYMEPDLSLSQDMCDVVPPPKEMEIILDKYFEYASPWVPILHMATFYRRIREPNRPIGMSNLLRAIVAATPLHLYASLDTHTSLELQSLKQYASECRKKAIASAIESHSKEATQSLIVIAFDSIKRGLSLSPWPLVAMISRRVVDIQMGFEELPDKPTPSGCFLSPELALQAAQTWVEVEERRRVFWAAFLMDRFCCIASGTAASIPSDNIRLRLPCDGYMWQQDLAVETGYFKTQQNDSSNEEDVAPFDLDSLENNDRSSGIGGLALTIEASESLALITQFHNRHNLDFIGPTKVSRWLSKFRQLDSRLLQWELCLTHRWRDVRVVNGYIDPNLTLAHLTHNAAIIVLHQPLAYPSAPSQSWLSGLVTAASREACVMAAKKINKIAQQFLNAGDGIPPHQFVYCLHTAGQLLKCRSIQQPNTAGAEKDIESTISALNKCSQRLTNGICDSRGENPAARYAAGLTAQNEASPKLNISSEGETAAARASQIMGPSPNLEILAQLGQMPTLLRHGVSPSQSSTLSWPGSGATHLNYSNTVDEGIW